MNSKEQTNRFLIVSAVVALVVAWGAIEHGGCTVVTEQEAPIVLRQRPTVAEHILNFLLWRP